MLFLLDLTLRMRWEITPNRKFSQVLSFLTFSGYSTVKKTCRCCLTFIEGLMNAQRARHYYLPIYLLFTVWRQNTWLQFCWTISSIPRSHCSPALRTRRRRHGSVTRIPMHFPPFTVESRPQWNLFQGSTKTCTTSWHIQVQQSVETFKVPRVVARTGWRCCFNGKILL